jgi:hypothetical protein
MLRERSYDPLKDAVERLGFAIFACLGQGACRRTFDPKAPGIITFS